MERKRASGRLTAARVSGHSPVIVPGNHNVNVSKLQSGLKTVQQLQQHGHMLGNHTYCHAHPWWPPITMHNPLCWQKELCRAHWLVWLWTLPGYNMKYYRTPGLDWLPVVAPPVKQVLPSYKFLADPAYNTVDKALAHTVKTLNDAGDKPIPWTAKKGQSSHVADLNSFLQTNTTGMIWIIMHDQQDNPSMANPKGMTLLKLVLGYLKAKGIPVGEPPGPGVADDICFWFLDNCLSPDEFDLVCPPQSWKRGQPFGPCTFLDKCPLLP